MIIMSFLYWLPCSPINRAPPGNYGPRTNFIGVNFDTTGYMTWPTAAADAAQWYREDVFTADSKQNDFKTSNIHLAMLETRRQRFALLPGRVE